MCIIAKLCAELAGKAYYKLNIIEQEKVRKPCNIRMYLHSKNETSCVPVALATSKQPLGMIAKQAAQEGNIQTGHISLCNNPKKHRFLLCMQQTTLLAYTLPRLLSIFISFT